MTFDREKNTRDILTQTVKNQRDTVRPHEVERTVDLATTLWKGNKGSGQAAREAIEIVKSGN